MQCDSCFAFLAWWDRRLRVREFDETFGPLLKQRFFERVYDLAYDTCQLLRTFRQARASGAAALEPNPHRQWIYLATTTSDVQDERDRVRRELLERGHVVLPDGPLPMLSCDVETAVGRYLEKCTLAVHLLGRRYGVTPEDSSESIPALQLRLTAESSQLLPNTPPETGMLSVCPSTRMLLGKAFRASPSMRIAFCASPARRAAPEANSRSERMEISTKPSPACTSTRPCMISGLSASVAC